MTKKREPEPVNDLRKEMQSSPFGKFHLEAYELSLKKNQDYATKENIFANFEGVKEEFGVKDSTGVAIRMRDKWMRFTKHVRGGEYAVKEETVRDTCLDIMNYAALYLAMVEKEEE